MKVIAAKEMQLTMNIQSSEPQCINCLPQAQVQQTELFWMAAPLQVDQTRMSLPTPLPDWLIQHQHNLQFKAS